MTPDQLLELATQQHRAGDLPAARQLYQQAIAAAPDHATALFRAGLLELQDGRAAAALPLILRAAEMNPADMRYQFGLGETLAALKQWDRAAIAYQNTIQIEPAFADAHQGLGNTLMALDQIPAAMQSYQLAIQFNPDLADAFNNLGNCHRLQGDLEQAAVAYEHTLHLSPNHAGAMSNLASIFHAQGRSGHALELLKKAVVLEPNVASHAINLAAVLCDTRHFAEAVAAVQPMVESDPGNAQAAFNLGNALQGLGRLVEAKDKYQRAIAIKRDYADALNNLGNIQKQLGDNSAAMQAYESAITAWPGFMKAINNAGCLLRTMGKLQEAEAMLRRGLAIDPLHAALHDNLANVLKDAGQLEPAIASYRRSLELDPASWQTHSNLAYALSFCDTDGKAILAECQRWNHQHAEPLRSQIQPHTNDRSPTRRLKIGYVSPDFREHCQSLFTIPVLSNHDHDSFEIICYSSVAKPDRFTGQLKGFADRWRDVQALDDAQLAEQIRADGIDILIDLTMHMAEGRPLLFARKPAPIQIAWLAYPGTTGIGAMDYRLSDPRLDPPDSQSPYTEKTIHLPDAFWCYHPLTDQPAVPPLPALTTGHITFGCLNNPCKLTDHTLRLWAAVMLALPTSRLMLMTPPGSYRQSILDRLAQHNITPDRITFLSYRPRANYLRSYQQIDLGLDTFPYNGHTTSLDALWMGVPVITRVGQTCVGRGGLSQLYQLDLLDLAAESDDAFVNIAIEWATKLPRLASLRQQLRTRLEQSPLMNGKRFTRNLEKIYRSRWYEWSGIQTNVER
jgi:predicted O-linked N-acetylglucosamine transferase (SPINDLY family)